MDPPSSSSLSTSGYSVDQHKSDGSTLFFSIIPDETNSNSPLNYPHDNSETSSMDQHNEEIGDDKNSNTSETIKNVLELIDEAEATLINLRKYYQNLGKEINQHRNLTALPLQSDPEICFHLINFCEQAKKTGFFTISDFNISFQSLDTSICSSISTIAAFANSGVGVVNLELSVGADDDYDNLQAELVEKVLHSSKDCLKKLNLSIHSRFFSLPKNIPVMPHLESLTIVKHGISQPAPPGFQEAVPFPPGFRFSQNCPNLKTFGLMLHRRDPVDENYLERVFDSTGLAPSVKSLSLKSYCPVKFDKALETFSGIESLEMRHSSRINFNSVWIFCRNLKSLKMVCSIGSDSLYIELVAQITGYPVDFLQKLWSSSDDLTANEIRIRNPPRTQPSISYLQDLEVLEIWYDGDLQYMNQVKPKFINMIWKLVLADMPKLKNCDWFY